MKLVGIISTAVLSLILGIAAPVYAQEQHGDQDEAKPAHQEEKAQQEDKKAQQEDKKAQQENPKQEEKNAQQQEKNNKQEEKNTQQQNKNTKEEKNAQPVEHGQQAQRGRIPDDRYKANFGREHTFRVSEGDYRNHRFQYGGYWFGFVDPWPANWLYTQEVFVVDINGVYYLCNPTYPGVNVALSFTL
ncbi:MAG TPA: hypothetical protein VMB18_09935 [Terriglobales bacterium]|nr:hypothetical protein [Terriglobales bacterium]